MYIKFALILWLRIIYIIARILMSYVRLNFTAMTHDIACLLLHISKLDWRSYNFELLQTRIVHDKMQQGEELFYSN